MTHDVDNPPHCERDTKRNEHEDIEITEEMIEAGIEAFCTFDPRFEREDSVVERIYAAMAAARHVKSRNMPRPAVNACRWPRLVDIPKEVEP
jgi:hypothetical protein